MATNGTPSNHKFLIHNHGDHVGVVTTPINKSEKVKGVYMDDGTEITLNSNHDVPLGHKIALVELGEGEDVMKYGIKIGVTSQDVAVGDYIHTHNIKTARW
ncbi:UxaA family hydrolase [Bacillus sp. FJAT-44742]|uniref:UxaA family hydrolase n=1 Tax=Bacillus sp. FJAT-44742 TaxID=2014005 RepID=UPI000C249955|nr:UxaA family hydrolase [Bacillus sp. FJAT-44742]